MKRSTWITAAVLLVIVGVIVAALFRQAASGPTFRAEDHATYDACIAAIPAAWGTGSMERSGAEDACRYVHRPSPRAPDRS
jgi:hypothetical protein